MAFLLICGFGIAGAVTAIYATHRLSGAIERVAKGQVPAMLLSLDVSRRAERLVNVARPLSSLDDKIKVDMLWKDIESGLSGIDDDLRQLSAVNGRDDSLLRKQLSMLGDNLRGLEKLTRLRVDLATRSEVVLRLLTRNRQAFQQQIWPRLRVLETYSAVLSSGAELSIARKQATVASVAHLVPAQRVLSIVQAVDAELLAATDAASVEDLAVSTATIDRLIRRLDATIPALDKTLGTTLAPRLTDLKNLVQGDSSIPELRQRGIILADESARLLEANEAISRRLGDAVDGFVSLHRDAIESSVNDASQVRDRTTFALGAVIWASLLASLLLLVLYVDRRILNRLGQLRDGMLALAAGSYDGPQPMEGPDEFGRMAAALAKFRETAIEAERLATHDPLTNIGNRRLLDMKANAVFGRGDFPALIVFDLDHFKRINDSWGHSTGDAVLKTVAAAALKYLGAGDCLARVGGEEFVILLPKATVKDANILAETVRSAIAIEQVATGEGMIQFTASFGVASALPGETSIEAAMQRADAALYVAKQGGRNNVRMAA